MLLEILKLILPIIVVLLIGLTAKKYHWFTPAGADAFRCIVSKIMLPAVLLDAFLFTDYSADIAVVGGIVFLWMLAALAVGYVFRRFLPEHSDYLPFLICSDEVGMLGYSLDALLFGTVGITSMAKCDLGHTFFFFAIAVPLIQAVSGKKTTAGGILKSIFSSIPFDAMILGIILGLLGVGNVIDSYPAGVIYHSIIDTLSAPTTVLILLALGYNLSFKPSLMRSVIKAYLLRLPVMVGIGTICSFIIFRFVPFSKPLMASLLLIMTLPPSYSTTLFGDLGDESEFVSTMISFSTLMGLIWFVGITIFALR